MSITLYAAAYGAMALIVASALILTVNNADRLKVFARGIMWPVTIGQVIYYAAAIALWTWRIRGPRRRLYDAWRAWSATKPFYLYKPFHEFVADVASQRITAAGTVSMEYLRRDALRWIHLDRNRP